METRSSILAQGIPRVIGAWRATVHREAKSQTRLKRLYTCTRREKNSFIALPGKGGYNELMPSELCVQPGAGREKFHSKWFKDGVISSWTLCSVVGSEVSGSQHHQPSGSEGSGVYMLLGSMLLTPPTRQGFQYLHDSSKTLSCVPLEGELRRCFEAAPLLLLFPCALGKGTACPSLNNNCLNLLLELTKGTGG